MRSAHRSFSPAVAITALIVLAWAGHAAWVWIGQPSPPEPITGTATLPLAITTVLALLCLTALWVRGQSIRRLY